MNAQQRLARGAGWFYWVAGLSLLNTVLALSGEDWRMVMGLGLTEFISAVPKAMAHGAPMGTGAIIFIIVANVIVLGIVAGFGWLSLRRQTWAFILGASLYFLDAGLLLFCQDWYSLAFHAFVLYQFFDGIKACFDLKRPQLVPVAVPTGESTPPAVPDPGSAAS